MTHNSKRKLHTVPWLCLVSEREKPFEHYSIGEFQDDYNVIHLKIFHAESAILDFKMLTIRYNIFKIHFFTRKKREKCKKT